jgi:hypothetical protein
MFHATKILSAFCSLLSVNKSTVMESAEKLIILLIIFITIKVQSGKFCKIRAELLK